MLFQEAPCKARMELSSLGIPKANNGEERKSFYVIEHRKKMESAVKILARPVAVNFVPL